MMRSIILQMYFDDWSRLRSNRDDTYFKEKY